MADHDHDLIGMRADGTRFERCTCGWESPVGSSALDALRLFIGHQLDGAACPSRPDHPSG